METVISIKPVLAVLAPMAGMALIMSSGRWPNLRESWTILASVAQFLIVISIAPAVLAGKTVEFYPLRIIPGIIELKFRVDPLGLAFATTASFLWIITSLYSIGYMRSLKAHSQTRYFACFAIALSAAVGIAFSANLFTLYLFYEMLTISTYPLVAHKETEEAFFAGWKYFVYLLGASVFQLTALILTYIYTSTLEFSHGGILPETASPLILKMMFAFFIIGYTKAAYMPLHSWLPTAMIAPTPVSALLHAVAVVKAGVFSILRAMLYVYGMDLMRGLGLDIATAYFALFTIIASSIFALTEDNLKRRLAFSTIGHLSYVILGGALSNPNGVMGGIMEMAMHAFGKITLFFCAGSIYVALHKENVSEMSGIGRKMPFTMLAFIIGALSMIGIPLCGGFISKWYLVLGLVEINENPLLFAFLSNTLLTAAYFLPIVFKAFFEKPSEKESEGIKEAPFLVVATLFLTGIGTVALFFYPGYFLSLAEGVIR